MEHYLSLCKKAGVSESAYKGLRKNSLHRKVVEPFLKSNQSGYCLHIEREITSPLFYPLLAKWDSKIKGPKYRSALFFLSPLTLRHGQIILELEREFGPLNRLRILQIGAGFGHLAACLSEIAGYTSYTILDLPECLDLQKKFLRDIPNITYLTPSQLNLVGEYDLVLCTFPFTQWGSALLRETTLKKIARIPKGYITCHAPWNPSSSDNYIEENLILKLAQAGQRVHCVTERGNSCPLQSILRWEHNKL